MIRHLRGRKELLMRNTMAVVILLCVIRLCASAQTVNQRMEPGPTAWTSYLQMCVDADCHLYGVSDGQTGNADAQVYFSAQTYAALLKLNALVVEHNNLLTSLNHSLGEQNNLLTSLNHSATDTNKLVAQQINTFNRDLRKAIDARFDRLPQELVNSDPIKQLRADIVRQIDDKLKTLQSQETKP